MSSYQDLNSDIPAKKKFSVCIATYKRLSSLKKLLFTIDKQLLPNDGSLEIIVVDNDPDGSAEVVAKEFAKESNTSISYFVQPVKNISITRNLAVANAIGDYLLFIDDDEFAEDKWISNLFKTLNDFDADGVFGLILPVFEKDAPDWIRKEQYYYSPVNKNGESARFKYTSNCLVKSKLVKQYSEPFNPQFGITGGEDVELFERLQKGGAKFVTCVDGVVYEHINDDRATLSYIFKRSFKGGNSHTRRLIDRAKGFTKIKLQIFMILKAILFGLIAIALMLTLFFNKSKLIYWLLKLASNMGRFSAAVGWKFKGYK